MATPTNTPLAYIGTYTKNGPNASGRADGLYVCQLNQASGALSIIQTVSEVINPSFVALDPQQRFLYAVDEVLEIDGQPGGAVSAFAVNPADGTLTFLNRQPSHGTDPCHVRVEPSGKFVLASNYGSGSVAMFPIQSDGSLGPASDTVQHVGSSVNPNRQKGPHAHSINPDPTGRFALVADLGLDKVLVYRLDLANGKLVPNDPPSVSVAPGAGPRHLAFHPNGRYAFVINEIGSTLTSLAWDAERGTLREIQTISTLPADFTGTSHCADVHVAPSGKFVYGSNRGHDSIAIFAIDAATGQLSYVGHESTRGRTPRNFAVDPTGTLLLAANQNTDTIVPFRVDPQTGKLSATGAVSEIPSAVCVEVTRS